MNTNRVRVGVYGMIPVALLQDASVTPNGLRVYIALSSFQGTSDYAFPGIIKIAERANLSERATIRAVGSLIAAGWVVRKRRHMGQTNIYQVLWSAEVVTVNDTTDVTVNDTTDVTVNDTTDVEENDTTDVEENDTTDVAVNDTTLKRSSEKRSEEEKKHFGPFVHLTDKEEEALVEKYGKKVIEGKIEDLNNWLGETGKRKASHYFTLLNWLRRDGVEPLRPRPHCLKCGQELIGGVCRNPIHLEEET